MRLRPRSTPTDAPPPPATTGRARTAVVASGLRSLADRHLGGRVVRRATRRRVVAAVLALVVGATVLHAADRAAQERARWGPTRRVLVAAHDLPAGSTPAPGSVRRVAAPAALVPRGALERLPPDRRRLATIVGAGEVLTTDRLLPPGTAQARPGPGMVAVAVTVPQAAPPVRAGDRVDVWSPGAGALDGTPVATGPLARAATVLRTARAGVASGGGALVVLSVPRERAGPLAVASLAGPVAVAVLP